MYNKNYMDLGRTAENGCNLYDNNIYRFVNFEKVSQTIQYFYTI